MMGQVENMLLQVRQLKGSGCKESVEDDVEDYEVFVEKIEDWRIPLKIWEVFSPIRSYTMVVVHPRAKPGLTLE